MASVSDNFFWKKAAGKFVSLWDYIKTAPMVILLASTCNAKGQSEQSVYKTGALDNASLRVWKALYYCPAQTKGAPFLRSYMSRTMIAKYPMINLL